MSSTQTVRMSTKPRSNVVGMEGTRSSLGRGRGVFLGNRAGTRTLTRFTPITGVIEIRDSLPAMSRLSRPYQAHLARALTLHVTLDPNGRLTRPQSIPTGEVLREDRRIR